MLYYIMWSMYFIGENLIRGGRNWSDYWNQVMGKILSSHITAKYTYDTT